MEYVIISAVINATTSAIFMGLSLFSLITFIALLASVITIIFVIFTLRDLTNNYIFLGIVSLIIALIWFVVMATNTITSIPEILAVVPAISVLVALFVLMLNGFSIYKAFILSKKQKMLNNYVQSVESEFKFLELQLENIEKEANSLKEKLSSIQNTIQEQLDRIEAIRIYSW